VRRKQARLSHRSAQSRRLSFIDLLHQFFFQCVSVQIKCLNLSEGKLGPVFTCTTETICQSAYERSALHIFTSWTEVLKFKFCGFVTNTLPLELQNVVEDTLITGFCYKYPSFRITECRGRYVNSRVFWLYCVTISFLFFLKNTWRRKIRTSTRVIVGLRTVVVTLYRTRSRSLELIYVPGFYQPRVNTGFYSFLKFVE
jgi:hypothetical protein